MYGKSKSAPKAQFRPMLRRGMCERDVTNASTVWPDSVLPLASVMVPLTMTGISDLLVSFMTSQANNAAFAFRVSNMVSTS